MTSADCRFSCVKNGPQISIHLLSLSYKGSLSLKAREKLKASAVASDELEHRVFVHVRNVHLASNEMPVDRMSACLP